jgi:hypothetical protein
MERNLNELFGQRSDYSLSNLTHTVENSIHPDAVNDAGVMWTQIFFIVDHLYDNLDIIRGDFSPLFLRLHQSLLADTK